MSTYDRGTRQLRNRRPDLHDFRVQPHGHTAPWDGGVVSVDVLAAGASSGGGGGGGGPTSISVGDGTVTAAGVGTVTLRSGQQVTDPGGGVAYLDGTRISAHGSLGATATFDPAAGGVHTGTLNANCTFTLTSPAAAGACELELVLTQDATGGRTVTWPGSVTVVGSLDTTANNVSTVVLRTLDGGTSWTAFVVGSGGSTRWAPVMASDGAGGWYITTDGDGNSVMTAVTD